MRYSYQKKQSPTAIAKHKTNEEFFARVMRSCDPELMRGAILLVGARDHRSLAVRHAQAALRYDRRASYFSHAALLVRASERRPGSSVGLEVALDPERPEMQVPERNGVTSFKLSRYFDDDRYPNLAVMAMNLKVLPRMLEDDAGNEKPQPLSSRARKDLLVDAALNPNRQREVYAMWEGLASWSRYTYCPEASDNPLLENIPHPGASLCEYAYAAAEVDIVPGATTSHTCPELLWATMSYFRESLETAVKQVRTYSMIRDEHATPRDSLSMHLTL